jgi:hypothetical protein
MWNLLLRTFDLLCSYFELWWSKINFESLFLSKLHDQVQSSISRWRLIGLFKLICVHFHLVSFNSWSVFLICWSLLHLGYSYVLQWIWLILKYDECFRLSFRIYVLFGFMTFNKNDIYVYTYAYMFQIVVGLLLLCVFYVGIICYQNWHVFVKTCWICLESICVYLVLPFKFAKGKM